MLIILREIIKIILNYKKYNKNFPKILFLFKIFLDTQKNAWYICSNLHNDDEEKSKRMELPKRAPAGEKERGNIC